MSCYPTINFCMLFWQYTDLFFVALPTICPSCFNWLDIWCNTGKTLQLSALVWSFSVSEFERTKYKKWSFQNHLLNTISLKKCGILKPLHLLGAIWSDSNRNWTLKWTLDKLINTIKVNLLHVFTLQPYLDLFQSCIVLQAPLLYRHCILWFHCMLWASKNVQ